MMRRATTSTAVAIPTKNPVSMQEDGLPTNFILGNPCPSVFIDGAKQSNPLVLSITTAMATTIRTDSSD
jgi:hypothetical protein